MKKKGEKPTGQVNQAPSPLAQGLDLPLLCIQELNLFNSVSGRSEIKAFEILVLFRPVQPLRVVDGSIDCDHLVKLLIFMC